MGGGVTNKAGDQRGMLFETASILEKSTRIPKRAIQSLSDPRGELTSLRRMANITPVITQPVLIDAKECGKASGQEDNCLEEGYNLWLDSFPNEKLPACA
jgi:hypothetical protein